MKTLQNQNKLKRSYFLKVFSGQKTERYRTHSIRRFLNKTRTIKWSKSIEIYLRVSCGYKIGGITAYNDGAYTNKKDFALALKAFLEK